MSKQQKSDLRIKNRKPKRRHPILRAVVLIVLVALFLAGGYAPGSTHKQKKQLRRLMTRLARKQSIPTSMAKSQSVFF